METTKMQNKEARTDNKQIGNRAGEVLLLSFCARLKIVILFNICAKSRLHRKAENRYAQCYDDSATDEHCSLTSNFCVKLDDLTGQI